MLLFIIDYSLCLNIWKGIILIFRFDWNFGGKKALVGLKKIQKFENVVLIYWVLNFVFLYIYIFLGFFYVPLQSLKW